LQLYTDYSFECIDDNPFLKSKYMKKVILLLSLTFILAGCSGNKKADGKYPVIDVVNEIGNYQRVYCSDLFSSMELIPLETKKECLISMPCTVILNDSLIVTRTFSGGMSMGVLGPVNTSLYAFDRSGKFLNPIGQKGQGPEEYISIGDPFFNTDQSTLFVQDIKKVIEYDYKGKFIRSFKTLEMDSLQLTRYAYAGNGLFIAKMRYNGINIYNYCLMDEKGNLLKGYPNHIFYHKEREYRLVMTHALTPVRVDNQLFLKDFINDTIYSLSNLELKPAFVFGFGPYTYPKDHIPNFNTSNPFPDNAFMFFQRFGDFVGAPNYFFYRIRIPKKFSGPKSKPVYNDIAGADVTDDQAVYGIYNIAKHTNVLLDTEPFYFQKGIINDLNGGLSFIPKYYAGNNEVIDIWDPADMKEMLTDKYFASLKIKDPQAHQKLKELLKTLKDDDNPVVVVAKLK